MVRHPALVDVQNPQVVQRHRHVRLIRLRVLLRQPPLDHPRLHLLVHRHQEGFQLILGKQRRVGVEAVEEAVLNAMVAAEDMTTLRPAGIDPLAPKSDEAVL